MNCRYKKLLACFCIFAVSVSLYFVKNPLPLMHLHMPTSMKEVAVFVKENFSNDYKIVTDNDYETIQYYIPEIKLYKSLIMPFYCTDNYDKCSEFLNNLPSGKYCFISAYKLKEPNIINSAQVNKFLHKNSSAIFFIKK